MEFVYLGFLINLFFLLFILISGKIDYLSPFSLHVVSWFFVFFVGLFVSQNFYPLTGGIFFKFIVWYGVVGIILLVMYLVNGSKKSKIISNIYNLKNEKILIFFVLIACLITFLEVVYVGLSGPEHFFLNLRLSGFLEDYNGPKYIFTPLLYLIVTPLFAISLMCDNAKKLKKITGFWQFLFIISTMGKLAFLTPLMIFFVIKYVGFRSKLKFSTMVFSVSILLLVSFVINNIRSSEDSDGQEIINLLGVYVYAPLISLGELVPNNQNFGEYTFRFFYAVFYKIGLNDILPVKTILDYVYVPYPSNVYTVMQPFYQDFGIFGVFYGALFYGVFYSLIYFKVVQKGGIFLVIYSLVSLNLIMSFLGETLITNFTLTLYLIVFSMLIWSFCIVKR